MLSYFATGIISLLVGFGVANIISTSEHSINGKPETLPPIGWVITVASFLGANLVLYAIGWAWIPIGILAGIIAAQIFVKNFDDEGSNLGFTAALSFTTTTVLCLAKEAEKNESQKTLWLVICPLGMLIAAFIVGKIKTFPAEKRLAKVKDAFPTVITGIFVIAAIVSVIFFVKEMIK